MSIDTKALIDSLGLSLELRQGPLGPYIALCIAGEPLPFLIAGNVSFSHNGLTRYTADFEFPDGAVEVSAEQ